MAVDVRISVATEDDARALVPRMRQVELDELRAANGKEPLDVLLDGLKEPGEKWSVFFGEELACMFGVVRGPSSVLGGSLGYAWLLTTHLVERYPKTFWKLCLGVLPQMLDRWDEVANAIDVRHEQAVRWAKRLGLRLADPAPFGPEGLPFRIFRARKEDIACAHRP